MQHRTSTQHRTQLHIGYISVTYTPAHNMHTHKHRQTYMQHTENSTENNAQPQHRTTENSAHNYRTYSLDYYHEYAYIKNSDTIELYTISKENI